MQCIHLIIEELKGFNYGLYLALMVRLFMPTVYQSFGVAILGALPDTSQVSIASQMMWVRVLFNLIGDFPRVNN